LHFVVREYFSQSDLERSHL